jgi:hypothetical protein
MAVSENLIVRLRLGRSSDGSIARHAPFMVFADNPNRSRRAKTSLGSKRPGKDMSGNSDVGFKTLSFRPQTSEECRCELISLRDMEAISMDHARE